MGGIVFTIDGAGFFTLEGCLEAFSREVFRKWAPSHPPDLRELDQMLERQGQEYGGFIVRWACSDLSRAALGHTELARYLVAKLARCHPDSRPSLEARITAARRGEGPTMFDEIVAVISDHGELGSQSHSGVRLLLE